MSKKEEVKDRLKKYIESGNSISYKEIKNNEPTLLYDIYRYLGNIESACNEIGISSEEMKIQIWLSCEARAHKRRRTYF